MSRHLDESYLPSDFFSRRVLELSFQLICNTQPGLATAIKKALEQITVVPYELLQTAHTGEMYFNAQLVEVLNVHTIGKIVLALTEIGEQTLQDKNLSAEYINQLRNVIDDWVQLTEWILGNFDNEKTVTL